MKITGWWVHGVRYASLSILHMTDTSIVKFFKISSVAERTVVVQLALSMADREGDIGL